MSSARAISIERLRGQPEVAAEADQLRRRARARAPPARRSRRSRRARAAAPRSRARSRAGRAPGRSARARRPGPARRGSSRPRAGTRAPCTGSRRRARAATRTRRGGRRSRRCPPLRAARSRRARVPSSTTVPSWLVIVVRSVQIGLSSRELEHLDLGGDLVARADRRAEVPVDVQEHAARAREVLGDDRVEQPGRHAALHDDPAEAARPRPTPRRSAAGCDRR